MARINEKYNDIIRHVSLSRKCHIDYPWHLTMGENPVWEMAHGHIVLIISRLERIVALARMCNS